MICREVMTSPNDDRRGNKVRVLQLVGRSGAAAADGVGREEPFQGAARKVTALGTAPQSEQITRRSLLNHEDQKPPQAQCQQQPAARG